MIEQIHENIVTYHGKKAATQYTEMLAELFLDKRDVPPPTFIKAVHKLVRDDWNHRGVQESDEARDEATLENSRRSLDWEQAESLRHRKVINFFYRHGEELTDTAAERLVKAFKHKPIKGKAYSAEVNEPA